MGGADAEDTDRAAIERRTRLIGVAGLVPPVVLSLWLVGIAADHVWRAATILLLTGYGAVCLSFLGGIRWGLVIGGRPNPATLAIGVLPPLAAWAALAVQPPYCFGLLAVTFAAHGAWDSFAAGEDGEVPVWFGRLRMQLTAGAVATMVLAFLATA